MSFAIVALLAMVASALSAVVVETTVGVTPAAAAPNTQVQNLTECANGASASDPNAPAARWYNYTVPPGIVSTKIELTGGGGGAGVSNVDNYRGGYGGAGATVVATIPRSVLASGTAIAGTIGCGGGGGSISTSYKPQGGQSGYGVGGRGGYESEGGSGGGASAVCLGTSTCAGGQELVVASGGGGGGGAWEFGSAEPTGGNGGNAGNGTAAGGDGLTGTAPSGTAGAGGAGGGYSGSRNGENGGSGSGTTGGGGGGGGNVAGKGGGNADDGCCVPYSETGGGGGAGNSSVVAGATGITYARDVSANFTGCGRSREFCQSGSAGIGGNVAPYSQNSGHGYAGSRGVGKITFNIGGTQLPVTEHPPASSPYGTSFGFKATVKDYTGAVVTGDSLTGISVTFNPGSGCGALIGTPSTSYNASTGIVTVTGVQTNTVCANNSTLTIQATDTTTGLTINGTTNAFTTVKANQTITITSMAPGAAIVGGSAYTIAATATSSLTVSFTSATPSVCTSTGANGQTIDFVGAGTCTINADQAGNLNYNPAPQVQQQFAVGRRATMTAVSCTNPFPWNGSSTCTATVTDTSPGTVSTPTGALALSGAGDGTASFTACNLSQVVVGQASCSSSMTADLQDTYSVSASFSQTSVHANSTGPSTASMRSRLTSMTVSCPPGSVTAGSPITCTATVTDIMSGTPIAPNGTVTFGQSGGGEFSNGGVCTLGNPSGASSSCSTQFTPTFGGNKTVTASFAGSTSGSAAGGFKHGSSAATPVPVTVSGPSGSRHTTSVTASCTPTSVAVGSPTTCTVIVTDTFTFAPKATPTGTVTWGQSGGGSFPGGNTCNLAELTQNLSAHCQVTFTPSAPAGNKTVQANYTATSNHRNGGSGSVFVFATSTTPPPPAPPTRHNTTTVLSCNPTTVPLGDPVSCTVTVTDVTLNPDPKSEPTGIVTWGQSGGGSFSPAGTCTLVGNGDGVSSSCPVATIFTPSGPKGNKTVNATYGGTTAHRGSGSGSLFIVAT